MKRLLRLAGPMLVVPLLLTTTLAGRPGSAPPLQITVSDIRTLRRLIARAVLGEFPRGLALVLAEGANFSLDGTPLNVTSGAEVTLLSEGRGATLDAHGASRVVEVSRGGRLTLRRVHLVRGWTTGGGGCALVRFDVDDNTANAIATSPSAAGTNGASETRLVLHECRLERCASDGVGGGVLVQHGTLSAIDSSLEACSAAIGGGGLAVLEGGRGAFEGGGVRGCTVVGTAGVGVLGGGVFVSGGNLSLSGTTIANSSAISNSEGYGGAGGGGMYVSDGTLSVTNVIMANNSAIATRGGATADGGGMYVNSGSSVRISGTTIANSSAIANGTAAEKIGVAIGGGLSVIGGTVTLDNSTISACEERAPTQRRCIGLSRRPLPEGQQQPYADERGLESHCHPAAAAPSRKAKGVTRTAAACMCMAAPSASPTRPLLMATPLLLTTLVAR